MKDVEFFNFMMPPSIWNKKPSPSRFKMDIEYAAKTYPGATPILSTREIREIPETEADHAERAKYICGYSKGGMTSEEIFATWRQVKSQAPNAGSDNPPHEPS
ncbi:hypothetical protein [Variovorax sp. PMC12]|uniref:hypothetical protein n=1 Tax=Variovorax sp. PMC12 TaxID=2126319 RepID=UPI000D127CEB|nr:hypothetical protein [Variovorax sp. PMC12]AVQ81629.1 hypothetical protein C4F17_12105 [Variovorax sp. PMC12]